MPEPKEPGQKQEENLLQSSEILDAGQFQAQEETELPHSEIVEINNFAADGEMVKSFIGAGFSEDEPLIKFSEVKRQKHTNY